MLHTCTQSNKHSSRSGRKKNILIKMSSKNQNLHTLKASLRDNAESNESLLRLQEDGTIKATGRADLFLDPDVYFDVVPHPDLRAGVLRYQFKPYNKQHQFLAVVNGKVTLKTESECTESQRSFYYSDHDNFTCFYVRIAGTSYYLSCKDDGELYVSSRKLDEASLFHMEPKDNDTILPAYAEELAFEANVLIDLIAEIALAEE